MESYKRNAVFAALDIYDFAFAKSGDFIEVTEWYNGEGFDVQISAQSGEQRMSFSLGEYQALRALCKELIGEEDDDEDVTSR